MNNIILHIPHSNTAIPKEFWQYTCIDKKTIDNFNMTISDLYTLELYGQNDYEKIIAPYSRIYCDIEKFYQDELEIMSQFGMGYVYTKTNQGLTFTNPSKDYKEHLLKDYYLSLHQQLDQIVSKSLERNKATILLDCHSFSKDIIMIENRKNNLPDICVGFDTKYYSPRLINYIKNFFEEYGYTVVLNYPYESAMIPDKYFNANVRGLYCVMIEINKSIYLQGFEKKANFTTLQTTINLLLQKLKKLDLD